MDLYLAEYGRLAMRRYKGVEIGGRMGMRGYMGAEIGGRVYILWGATDMTED